MKPTKPTLPKSKTAIRFANWKRTPKGFLLYLYSEMKRRVVKGKGTCKPELYKGKSILTQDEFLNWALENPIFLKLFNNYLENGRELKLAPSIDRKNPKEGYTLDNIQWLTQGQNSAKASKDKNNE